MRPKLVRMLLLNGSAMWSTRLAHGPWWVMTACEPKPKKASMANRPFFSSWVFRVCNEYASLPKPAKLKKGPPAQVQAACSVLRVRHAKLLPAMSALISGS